MEHIIIKKLRRNPKIEKINMNNKRLEFITMFLDNTMKILLVVSVVYILHRLM